MLILFVVAACVADAVAFIGAVVVAAAREVGTHGHTRVRSCQFTCHETLEINARAVDSNCNIATITIKTVNS